MLAKFYIPMSCAAAVAHTQKALALQFGGYTRHHATGAWMQGYTALDRSGPLIEEAVVVLEVACYQKLDEPRIHAIARKVTAYALKAAGEKDCMYIVDNQPHNIDLTKELN